MIYEIIILTLFVFVIWPWIFIKFFMNEDTKERILYLLKIKRDKKLSDVLRFDIQGNNIKNVSKIK